MALSWSTWSEVRLGDWLKAEWLDLGATGEGRGGEGTVSGEKGNQVRTCEALCETLSMSFVCVVEGLE